MQRIRGNARRYPDGFGEAHPLTGLMYCADCGGKMYVHRTYNGKRVPQYTCGQYGKYPIGSLCPTQHRIKAEAVLTLIADMLRAIAEYSKNDRAEFIRTVQETQAAQQTADISKKRKRLAAAQKRAGELERLICKIYEDNALGKLPDARYEALDAQYAKEQDALNAEITELEKAVTGYEQSRKSAEKFIALIDKYENFDTLTNTMLNEFVEKILVHERARKGSQDTTQEVEIYFNFVGRYMNSSYYDLRGKIVQAERRIATLTERGEMWAQYNKYKPIRKQLAKVKPEKRELFEQRHSRELILYDAAARYLKELKDSGEEITPKAWQREIDLLTAQKQVDTIDMKAMREELKAVERLRKAADQLARQEQDKSHDRGPER